MAQFFNGIDSSLAGSKTVKEEKKICSRHLSEIILKLKVQSCTWADCKIGLW